MKSYRTTCWCMIAILVIGVRFSVNGSPEPPLDKNVQTRTAELTSVAAKIEYLTTTALEKSDDSETSIARKSSALRLLGELGMTNSLGTNAIEALVKNIAWIDQRSHSSPASHALVLIGEPVVSDLLRSLGKYPETVNPHSTEDQEVWWTVMTICSIKKNRYPDFVAEQKAKLPKKAWEKLVQYGTTIDLGR